MCNFLHGCLFRKAHFSGFLTGSPTVVLKLSWEPLHYNLKPAPYVDRREREEKKADYSRLVRNRFNKQENLHDTFLGQLHTSRLPAKS